MKQILIVEDDSFLNKMLAYNLTADGYSVTSALNAKSAAESLRRREYDLVLLAIAAGFVLIICLVTPILTYRSDTKNSVVERLRMAE